MERFIQTRQSAGRIVHLAKPFVRWALGHEFATVMDFGCGYGLQVAQLAAAGRAAHGVDVEFTPAALAEAAQHGYTLHSGSWDQLEADAYDAGISHHCLEHARDPVLWLHQWGWCLKPGAPMFVAVPGYTPVLSAGHISAGFDPGKLAYLMAVAGFDCSHGEFRKVGECVWGMGYRPPTMEIADTNVTGWTSNPKLMPVQFGIKEGCGNHILQPGNWIK